MSIKKDKIGWGILGPGIIANDFASCLGLLDDAYVAAVGSRTLSKSEEFCKKYGGKPYGSYEEMCNDPDVDIVYVATPHPFHEQHVIMACNAGKNVLCEKPFAVNRQQAERMIAAAKKNDVFIQEGLWSRFFPAWQYVKEQVSSGRFGQLIQVRCATCWGAEKNGINIKHRLIDPDLAGGSLLDAGIYSLAAMSWTRGKFDMPVNFRSILQFEEFAPVDSDVDMVMTFEDGFSAYLQSSLHRSDMECEIVCRNGRIIIPVNRNPSRIYIQEPVRFHFPPQPAPKEGEEPPKRISWRERMRELPLSQRRGYQTTGGDLTVMEFPYFNEGFQFEAEVVQDCLRKGLKENPQATLEETLFLITLADRARSEGGLVYPFEKA